MFNSYKVIGVTPVIQEEAVSLGSSAVLTNDWGGEGVNTHMWAVKGANDT